MEEWIAGNNCRSKHRRAGHRVTVVEAASGIGEVIGVPLFPIVLL